MCLCVFTCDWLICGSISKYVCSFFAGKLPTQLLPYAFIFAARNDSIFDANKHKHKQNQWPMINDNSAAIDPNDKRQNKTNSPCHIEGLPGGAWIVCLHQFADWPRQWRAYCAVVAAHRWPIWAILASRTAKVYRGSIHPVWGHRFPQHPLKKSWSFGIT